MSARRVKNQLNLNIVTFYRCTATHVNTVTGSLSSVRVTRGHILYAFMSFSCYGHWTPLRCWSWAVDSCFWSSTLKVLTDPFCNLFGRWDAYLCDYFIFLIVLYSNYGLLKRNCRREGNCIREYAILWEDKLSSHLWMFNDPCTVPWKMRMLLCASTWINFIPMLALHRKRGSFIYFGVGDTEQSSASHYLILRPLASDV